MVKKGLETVVTRDLGTNAADLICQLAASGVIPALEELVANAHDADATRIDIDYDQAHHRLTISDNGTGMDEEGIASFYRLGDSQKVKHPITKKGRRCIGKFGIATILLKYLAKGYRLETIKGSRKIQVSETFSGALDSKAKIPYKVLPARNDVSGTTIVLDPVNFEEGDNRFSLADFKKRVQWDMPILPDLQIYVNGELIKSKYVESASEYRVDETGDEMGEVSIELYVTKRPTKDAGVHVYVNGRRVGDHKSMVQTSKIRQRVVAIVKADGLEDAILMDRGRFKEDHAGVKQLAQTVKTVLAKVEYDYRREKAQGQVVSMGKRVSQLLEEQAKSLAASLTGVVGDKLRFELLRGKGICYDAAKEVIFLDEDDPRFKIAPNLDLGAYRAFALSAAIDAIARTAVSSTARLDVYDAKRKELLGGMHRGLAAKDNPDGLTVELPFQEFRMYEHAEVARIAQRPLGLVRRLCDVGALRMMGEKVRGAETLKVFTRLKGYTTLYELVHKQVTPEQMTSAYETATQQVHRFANDVPFIINLGSKGEPCYAIRDAMLPRFKELMDGGALDRRKDPKSNPLLSLGEDYLSLEQVGKRLGLTQTQVSQAIDYGRLNGTRVGTNRTGNGTSYHCNGVAVAARKMGLL